VLRVTFGRCDGVCLSVCSCVYVCVCVCVIDRRIAEHLEQNLPNLDTLILTGNNIQELGDVDTLSSVTTLTTLRFELTTTRFHLLQTSHHTNIHQKNFVKSGTHQLKAIFAMNYIFCCRHGVLTLFCIIEKLLVKLRC